MQKDTPLTNDTLSFDSILCDNMELLIMHRAYRDLTENDEKKEEQKDADKN